MRCRNTRRATTWACRPYEIIEAYGPDHDRHFTAQVSIQGKPMAQGRGCSKKHAEMEAAKKALEMLEGQGNSKA